MSGGHVCINEDLISINAKQERSGKIDNHETGTSWKDVRWGHEQGESCLQGYLAHKKKPTPLGPPYDPRHGPTVGS